MLPEDKYDIEDRLIDCVSPLSVIQNALKLSMCEVRIIIPQVSGNIFFQRSRAVDVLPYVLEAVFFSFNEF